MQVGRALSLRELRRGMQMVFQDSYASLNPRLTIEESIAFGPKVHGMADAGRARAGPRTARQGGSAAGNLCQSLSARDFRRPASARQYARALALSPRLVILDEAVSALDKSVEAQVLNLLVDLKREFGLTYLFISHDLNVVRYISDRVLVMISAKWSNWVRWTGCGTHRRIPIRGRCWRRCRLPIPIIGRNATDFGRPAQSDRSAVGVPVSHPLSVRGAALRKRHTKTQRGR